MTYKEKVLDLIKNELTDLATRGVNPSARRLLKRVGVMVEALEMPLTMQEVKDYCNSETYDYGCDIRSCELYKKGLCFSNKTEIAPIFRNPNCWNIEQIKKVVRGE